MEKGKVFPLYGTNKKESAVSLQSVGERSIFYMGVSQVDDDWKSRVKRVKEAAAEERESAEITRDIPPRTFLSRAIKPVKS